MLLEEVLNRDPIVKSSDSVSKTLPPEETVDSEEAEEIKFFIDGGRKCRSSNSSAKSSANELEADLWDGAGLLVLGMGE